MGGTTITTTTLRFLTLLSSSSPSPLPLLRRPSSLLLLRRFTFHRYSLLLSPFPAIFPLKCSQQHQPHQPIWDDTHSLTSHNSYSHHPWPEFIDFVNWISTSNANSPLDNAPNFINPQQMSPHFFRDAIASLAFARAHPLLIWSLPREDIEVIIDNGSPFLFQNGSATMQRMKFFERGGSGTNDVLESDKPTTIDLMEFLLSYAHLAIGNSENMHSRVESSVRRLFCELAKTKEVYVESVATAKKFSASYGQVPRSLGMRVEMKKGDWICTRCSFMNFAKNSQCLDCKESRPKKLITGGEWECPQCNFFNFSRNLLCLRCDCKKPGLNPFIDPTSSSSLRADSSIAKSSTEKVISESKMEQPWFTKMRQLQEESDMNSALENELVGEKPFGYPSRQNGGSGEHIRVPTSGSEDYEREQAEKSERWFKKVAELHDVEDFSKAISDEDFPEIMPMRKGETRFVIGKKKDRSLISPMYKRKAAMEQAGNNKYVPFVPFPPGYFAKDNTKEATESTNSSQQTGSVSSDFEQAGVENEYTSSTMVSEASNNADQTRKSLDSNLNSPDEYHSKAQSASENESERESWMMKSLEGSAVKEPDPLDMSEEAKAERWFRRVAQIKDISELSEIPDEDFPSIMPMRKGVNRFVVSKRKTPLERRLTSSQYRRNLPIENSEPMGKDKDSN